MCGIAGIYGSGLSGEEARAALGRMAAAMSHRGPDQEAVVPLAEIGGGVAVRRLALVDLEGGGQPIASEDGRVLALLNGEIYNHVALRRWLEGRGHRFRTRCDTEVLAHLYEEEGDGLLERLEGMFALAIVDLARRRVLLARDGPGMKPLYVARTPRGVAFASETAALFASGLARPAPDLAALDVGLAVGFLPAPRTPFAGVEKLVAGTALGIGASGVETRTFERFAYRRDDPPSSDAEYVDELERRLDAAVASHLAADVPIGALLSGGWDSSLVATLAARRLGRPLRTFSLVFPDAPEIDESRHARLVARTIGSDHHEIEYRAERLPEILPAVVRHLEEPMAASPAPLSWLLASLAAAHVKGVVGGEGADELFGGYEWFRSSLPYAFRRAMPSGPARWAERRVADERVRRWLRIAAAPDLRAADAEWKRLWTPWEKRRLLRPGLFRDGPDLEPVQIGGELAASCRDGVQRRLASELRGRLADGILLKHEKLGMAHALEARFPFLDRAVVRLAERLPSRLKMHRGREKVVVRALAERHLPPEIAARRKQGLAFPPYGWLRPPAFPGLRSLLLDGAAGGGPFDRPAVERWLAGGPRGRLDDRRFAVLVTVQVWWSQHFGRG